MGFPLPRRSPEEVETTVYLATDLPAGSAICDSGCIMSVAGRGWHEKMQQYLAEWGMQWIEIPQSEAFRFGAGETQYSSKAIAYPVSIAGHQDVLMFSVVETECPGLISQENIQLNFQQREIQLGNKAGFPIQRGKHPAIPLQDWSMVLEKKR
eukprot:1291246-Amphidinium_carterae.1